MRVPVFICEVKPWSHLARAEAYPGFRSMKRLGVFLLPLDGMLAIGGHSPQFDRLPQQFASTHLYTWVERDTVRVKCLAQEYNTVSPARALTRTARTKYIFVWFYRLVLSKQWIRREYYVESRNCDVHSRSAKNVIRNPDRQAIKA